MTSKPGFGSEILSALTVLQIRIRDSGAFFTPEWIRYPGWVFSGSQTHISESLVTIFFGLKMLKFFSLSISCKKKDGRNFFSPYSFLFLLELGSWIRNIAHWNKLLDPNPDLHTLRPMRFQYMVRVILLTSVVKLLFYTIPDPSLNPDPHSFIV